MKKQTSQRAHLSLDTLEESRKRLGEHEMSEVELKIVSGGIVDSRHTWTTGSDID